MAYNLSSLAASLGLHFFSKNTLMSSKILSNKVCTSFLLCVCLCSVKFSWPSWRTLKSKGSFLLVCLLSPLPEGRERRAILDKLSEERLPDVTWTKCGNEPWLHHSITVVGWASYMVAWDSQNVPRSQGKSCKDSLELASGDTKFYFHIILMDKSLGHPRLIQGKED